MAQYPTERGLEEIKQHVVDKPAHAQSSGNLSAIYSKTAPLRKDRFCLLPYCPRRSSPKDAAPRFGNLSSN
jgi:hypothetical protein